MKVWEKMLEDERKRFDHQRKMIDEEELRTVDAMKHFVETGFCSDTGYAMYCVRCPFRIECNVCKIKNGRVLSREYLKEGLMREVEK